jgi:trans-aconitate methyltransferase
VKKLTNPIVLLGHKLLGNSFCYDLFQAGVGATKTRRFLIDTLQVWENPNNVIDLGCGTGFSIPRLTGTKSYLGIDFSSNYLDKARSVPTKMSTSFKVGDLGKPTWTEDLVISEPQVVLAMGLFHHLNDDQMETLFSSLSNLLPGGSCIISMDPVIVKTTSRVAKWVANNDRGKHVRTPNQLEEFIRFAGFGAKLRVFENQIRIPADSLVGVISVP